MLLFHRCTAPVKLPTCWCLPLVSPAEAGLTRKSCSVKSEVTRYDISKETLQVGVFQGRLRSPLRYTSEVPSQQQTRVKLNRVFFPRCLFQARSLGCGFAV